MGHYAKVLNGIVTQVIVADAEFFDTFVDSSPGEWIQTSYNTRGGVHYAPNSDVPDGGEALRGNYAGINYTYDRENDVFYPQRPTDVYGRICASWTISAPNWTWTPPIPYPDVTKTYVWDEEMQTWNLVPN